MALTKADMAEKLFEELGLNKREAKDFVEAFFEEVRAALEKGEQVKLSGFGNFNLRDKKQRPGRNPKTGEEIPITARRVVTFHPGQKLKARVLRYWEQEFPQLKPVKRRGNRRYYQHHDVVMVREIRSLLYEHGFTIGGARQRLAGNKPKANGGQGKELVRQLRGELEELLSILKN